MSVKLMTVAAAGLLAACGAPPPVDNAAAVNCTPGEPTDNAASVCPEETLANGQEVVANAD